MVKIDRTEDYDRTEITTRRVEYQVAPRLSAIQAAIQQATRELTDLGLDPDTIPINYHVDRDTRVGVISYEIDVDDVEEEQYVLPTDENGFAAILAALPRDWPRLVRDMFGPRDTDVSEDVLKLVDEWVLGVVSREDRRT